MEKYFKEIQIKGFYGFSVFFNIPYFIKMKFNIFLRYFDVKRVKIKMRNQSKVVHQTRETFISAAPNPEYIFVLIRTNSCEFTCSSSFIKKT